jgi:hypothetical protein
MKDTKLVLKQQSLNCWGKLSDRIHNTPFNKAELENYTARGRNGRIHTRQHELRETLSSINLISCATGHQESRTCSQISAFCTPKANSLKSRENAKL